MDNRCSERPVRAARRALSPLGRRLIQVSTLVSHPLLDGLNDSQRAAVVHRGGPLLIVAGAGSGKTRVLTHRIAYLLGERGAQPGEILAITFTNKAAGEMRERVEALVGNRSRAMWVMTFHSACVRILRREAKRLGFPSGFSIYDQADSQRLMALVCRELDLDPKRYPPRGFSAQVSNLKNELIDYETFKSQASTHLEKTLAEAYETYQARLQQAGAMDFDDLIMTTVNLLQAFPDVAEHYRRRFRHVLVDEYQDTNHAQYVLVRELVGQQGDDEELAPAELCVVGDADQSIYAFRGATIRNILEFERDYPDASVILLEQNYRSTQTILSAANAVIERNADRKPKRLWSDQGDGPKVTGYVADNEHDEAAFVAQEIDRLHDDEDIKPGQVAVFYRTNAQSRVFEEVFIRVGLPYKVVGGVRFYERKEIRDLLAYLRVLGNPEDTVSLRRILNVPKRGIGDRAEACVEALAGRERISFWQALRRADDAPAIATRSLNQIKDFVALLDELGEMVETSTPAELVEAILTKSGYLAELEASRDPQDETRIENLREMESVAAEFEERLATGLLAEGDGERRGRGAARRGPAGRVPGAGRARRRRRPDPRRAERRRPARRAQPREQRRRGHADDPAHRQGPGVPGGVPHRHGRRRLPAPALARRPQAAGGGAAARLRRHHPGPAAALRLPGDDAQLLGRALLQPGVALPHRDPRDAGRVAAVRGLGPGHSRDGVALPAAGRAFPGQPRGARAVHRRPGRPRRLRARHGRLGRRRRRKIRGDR